MRYNELQGFPKDEKWLRGMGTRERLRQWLHMQKTEPGKHRTNQTPLSLARKMRRGCATMILMLSSHPREVGIMKNAEVQKALA